jgi:murein DD-endopeptidase MepM/ murein hydrolase activator NlpD
MRTRVASCESKRVSKILVAAFLASTAAACSGDTSRFSGNPFTNPFAAAPSATVDKLPTGSLPSRTAPIGAVSSQPLPPALPRTSVPNPLNPVQSAAPTIQPLPRVASSTLQQASPIGGSAAGWTAAGGTPVSVAAGDSVNALSARYGVPAAAITAANPGGIRPGQQAIIPVYSGGAARSGLMAPAAPAPVAAPVRASAPVQPVAQAATVVAPVAAPVPQRIVTPPQRPVAAAPAPQSAAQTLAARPLAPAKAVKPKADDDDDEDETPAAPQQRIVAAAPKQPVLAAKPVAPVAQAQPKAPTVAVAKPVKPLNPAKPETDEDEDDEDESPKKKAEAPVAQPKPMVAQSQPRPQPRVIPLTPQAPKAEQVDPAPTAAIPAPKPQAAAPAPAPAPAASAAADDKADFRWPARGRVISGFGSKGGNGDGIAIAVPEGTAVKAAGDGVVAYAGEELKGYGKLVLVRHENGFVSAYAHNGELNVKRGEKVSRGQTIAKSGSTGNVTSPQLHFELRKGSTPVDPTKHLE